MNGQKKTVSEMLAERSNMLAQREAIDIKMNEIADKAAAEKRELTAEESVKYQQLQSDFNKLGREIAMNQDTVGYMQQHREGVKSQNQMLREYLQGVRNKTVSGDIVLSREVNPIKTTNLETGGMVPLTIKDVLPPLEMGLIFDKVGIPVQTGVVGNIQWPVVGAVEAEIQGETLPLTDQSIDLSKVAANPVRIGITIRVSNQAINDTSTDLEALIKDQMKMGVRRTINRACFSHENFNGSFHGPFAGAHATGVFAGQVPTYAELLAMKGKVAATGVEMIGFCYVMSESMKSILEATPIDAGSGKMIIENGKINGYDVFCTETINYGSAKSKDSVEHIAAGCWGYLPLNQHGEARLIVDPFTEANKDVTRITLNADWSMTTLRAEAFAAYKCAPGA